MTLPDSFAGASVHLLRTRSRIMATLEMLAARHDPVDAEVPELGALFRTHIVLVDPLGEFIAISAPVDAALNSALLALERVSLVARPRDWQVRFDGVNPKSMAHEGRPLVRLNFPQVLAVQQRRTEERLDPTAPITVRCVADAGGITPFDAQISDISLGGISVLIYPADVTLSPGTVLVASRIEIPGAEPITVDLEVRYSEPATLEDGRLARRSGFRLLNLTDAARQRLAAVMARD